MSTKKLSFRQVVVSVLAAAALWVGPARSLAASAPDDPNKPGIRNANMPFAGQLSSLFKIDDDNPEATVPTAYQRSGNPIEFGYYLQDLMAKAEAADKRNDRPAKIRFLRALAAAVPDQAKGWSLLCEEYEKANDRQRAVGACKYAIDREGVELKDFQRFVHMVAMKDGDLDNDEKTALNETLAHLDRIPELTVPTAQMRCEAAVKTSDRKTMEACTAVLAKAAPNDPKTIVFQWSLAMMRGERDDARQLIDRARGAGLATEAIERMNNLTAHARWTRLQISLLGAFGILSVVGAYLALRRWQDARRLGATAAAAPLPPG